MKHLVQHLKTGDIELIEAPVPRPSSTGMVIRTTVSLISAGTERMLLEFGQSSWLEKAKRHPDKVKQVLEKIQTDGLLTTVQAVKSKLDTPLNMGYSNVGVVHEIGRSVEGFQLGDRVVSNGSHAEFVQVSRNLIAKIPDTVSDETAAFTVLGAIALQGIRLLGPQLGETVVVIGLGLIGQLAVQLLVNSGCKVIGVDVSAQKVRLAESFGAIGLVSTDMNEWVDQVVGFSNGHGADGVLITAASKSNTIIENAAKIARKRGKVVLVGVVGLDVPRQPFYDKELTFQVSCSYGPGRYDPSYEDQGVDYPYGYVRWTEQRNFEAVLHLMAHHKLVIEPLITHRFAFEQAKEAYHTLTHEAPMGLVLTYGQARATQQVTLAQPVQFDAAETVVGVIGVGQFVQAVLLPALQKSKAVLHTLASASGVGSVLAGRKFGFLEATSDYDRVLQNPAINTVVITTRHGSHAQWVCRALEAGKHVFVEKPLALSWDELRAIQATYKNHPHLLMVGFNRRFSVFSQALQQQLRQRQNPLCVSMMVNAGYIPHQHWVHDPVMGGGRVLGEACHFIDLARFLVGHPIVSVMAVSTQGHSETDADKVAMTLQFQDGSIATIHYFANGSKKFPKERVEVFCEQRVWVLDNFKSLVSYGGSGKSGGLKQDKGHQTEIEQFLTAIRTGQSSPIPFEELIEVTAATLAVVDSLQTKAVVSLL